MTILGIGGHSKVIIDILNLIKSPIVSIYDDDITKEGTYCRNLIVKSPICENIQGECIIAIGSNLVRKEISERILRCNWRTVIHPSAIIAKDVIIGNGSVIMAGAIIQSGTIIGKHSIINTGACIDHDTIIDDFVHIAPNVSIAGGVKIGVGTFIGIGATIVQNIIIGNWSTVGAGSVIIRNVEKETLVFGNPGRVIE